MGGGKRCGHTDLIYCGQNVATEAFAWIEWILLCFYLAFMIAITVVTARRGDRVTTPMSLAA